MSTANGAAEKWEMSADGMTWTFLLRKGITFHDGTELSAEDVKWSLEMVTKPESIAAFAARLRATIKEIEVADPHALIIRTHKPDLWLAQDLSMAAGYEGAILPKKYAHRHDPDWRGGDHQRQPGAGARYAGPRLQCLREGAR